MIAWIGTAIIAAMLIQHRWIDWRSERASWARTLGFYRWIMRAAVLVSILFVFGSAILLAMDYSSRGHFGYVTTLSSFIVDNTGPVSVLFIAFFAGILRLFAERAMGDGKNLWDSVKDILRSFFDYGRLSRESTVGKITSGTLGQKKDAWFEWMCLSLIVTFANALLDTILPDNSVSNENRPSPEAILPTSPNPEPGAGALAACLASVVYVAIAYFLWIYMVLFAKLTQGHHLTSRAARLFLGGILRDQVPDQSVMIGPPHAGKSYFCRQIAGAHASRRAPAEEREYTGRIDIRNGAVTQVTAAGLTTFQLTALDTPGENMGDHILLASIFRSDGLIFVLDREMLDLEALEEETNYAVPEWHNLIVETAYEATKQTRAYLQGFHLATSRSGGGLIETEQLYQVKSFVLYLNEKTPAQYLSREPDGGRTAEEILSHLGKVRAALDRHQDWWQQLSQEIGWRFGVAKDNCCCIGGNASAQYGSNLLPLSTAARLKQSDWPGNSEPAD